MNRNVIETVVGFIVLAIAIGFVVIAYQSGSLENNKVNGYRLVANLIELMGFQWAVMLDLAG